MACGLLYKTDIFNNKFSAADSFPLYLAPLPRDNMLCSFFYKLSVLFNSNTKEISCFFTLSCHFYPLHQFSRMGKIDGPISVQWVYFFPVFTWNYHSYPCLFSQWIDFTFSPYNLKNSLFYPPLISIIKVKIDTKGYFFSLLIIENLSYITLSICLVTAQQFDLLFFFYFSLSNVVNPHIFV